MGKNNETQLNTSAGSNRETGTIQEFYRPKQVTELLGISMRTYYTLVEKSKLHPIKIAERVTLISRTEIFNMIEKALGETLSQSIFAKGKRFGTIDVKDSKGKEDGSSAAKGGKEAKPKRTAQDRAPVGVTHDIHYTMAEMCSTGTFSATLGKVQASLTLHSLARKSTFHKRGNKLYFFEDELFQWVKDGGCGDVTYPDIGNGNVDDAKAEQHLKALQSNVKRKPKSSLTEQ